MSFEAMCWAASSEPQSTGAARALLCILANLARKEEGHTCWPSDETLAETLHCGVRTVWRYIDTLKDAGDIAVQSGGGRFKRNIYSFPALLGTIFTANSGREYARNPANSGRESTPETLPTVAGNTLETLPNCAENPAKTDAKPCQTARGNPATIGRLIKQPVLTTTKQQPEKQPRSSSTSAAPPENDDDDDSDALTFWLGDHSQGWYSASELRCAARSLATENGLYSDWAGFDGWLKRADPQKIAWLLTWLQFYGDKALETHQRIKSFPGVLLAHLKADERAYLRPQQMAELEVYIAKANYYENPDANLERFIQETAARHGLSTWVPAQPVVDHEGSGFWM